MIGCWKHEAIGLDGEEEDENTYFVFYYRLTVKIKKIAER